MSRSGYSDDYDDDTYLRLGSWRGRVASALRGKRGQKLLFDLVTALDAMPVKRLIKDDLRVESEDTSACGVCALGAVAKLRGIDTAPLEELVDANEHDGLGAAFDIAGPLAAEIMYENDENALSPEQRWQYMRKWALAHLRIETILDLQQATA